MKLPVALCPLLLTLACVVSSPAPSGEAAEASVEPASAMPVTAVELEELPERARPGVPEDGKLVVHEWGTFTARVDPAGNLLTWTEDDRVEALPKFVNESWMTNAKQQARGTVRMETPVLYFYAAEPTQASATVEFPGGFLTEWYPFATHEDTTEKATLSWPSFAIVPGPDPEYPIDGDSHYYAARETDAAPLEVAIPGGTVEREKMLFYRGVGSFALPLEARTTRRGMEVAATTDLRGVIVFQRRKDKVGFALLDELSGTRQIDIPPLTAELDEVRQAMQRALEAEGLYPREAEAMIETWQALWFDDGLRVLYMVPRELTDATLPLTLEPTPDELVRVLVGRLDLPG